MTATTTADVPPIQSQQHDLFLRLQTIDEMVRANEEVERRLERIAERRRIPPVPDLRFEYSYVRSVAPFVHIDSTGASGKGKEKETSESDVLPATHSAGEVVRVEWGKVLWITTRDQLISPLLQGALWCVYFMSIAYCKLCEHTNIQGCRKPFPPPTGCRPRRPLPSMVVERCEPE